MKPTVVLQTDFGSGGGGAMAGVIKSLDPEICVYDDNHNIEPFNVREAAYGISCIMPYWPSGTIFVSVVDPGVGTTRKSCVAKLKNGSYIVTPDNGVLSPMLDEIVEIRSIDEGVNRLPGSENVFIFHGRDVYAYTAGKLAAGMIDFEGVGPVYPKEDIVTLRLTEVSEEVKPGYARGGIYNMEVSYGCLRINIHNNLFQKICGFSYGDILRVTILDGDRTVFSGKTYYARTFGDVPNGEPMICGDIQCGDKQMLRFTVNNGNFIMKYAPELSANLTLASHYVWIAEALKK